MLGQRSIQRGTLTPWLPNAEATIWCILVLAVICSVLKFTCQLPSFAHQLWVEPQPMIPVKHSAYAPWARAGGRPLSLDKFFFTRRSSQVHVHDPLQTQISDKGGKFIGMQNGVVNFGSLAIVIGTLVAWLHFKSILLGLRCEHEPKTNVVLVLAAASGDADDQAASDDYAPNDAPKVEVLSADDTMPVENASATPDKAVAWMLRYGIGQFCFFCQLWLSAISAAVLVFAYQYIYSATGAYLALAFTSVSNVASWVSLFWALRCRHAGKLLNREIPAKNGSLPTKGQVVRLLWSGLIINAQGLLAAILGIEINSGLLLAQSLTAGPPVLVPGYGRGVAAFDIFAQLAQAQSLLSLILGVCIALHALRVINRPFVKTATAL